MPTLDVNDVDDVSDMRHAHGGHDVHDGATSALRRNATKRAPRDASPVPSATGSGDDYEWRSK